MASNSDQRSGSSDRSKNRRRVVIGPEDTTRVRYDRVRESADRGSARPAGEGRRTDRGGTRPVPGDLTSAGRRVAGSRAEERDRRLHSQRRRAQFRLALIAATVVAVIAGGVVVYRSNAFAVERVEVVGAERLSDEEVRALAAVPANATLLRLGAADIERRVERSAWISAAEVSRDYPDGVRIRVVERKPAALVDAGGSTIWLADPEGIWLASHSPETTSTLVLIRDVPGLDPVAGRRTGSETLLNALEVVERLDPAMRALVKTVVAPEIDKTALITADDIEIFVGSSDEITRKQEIARKILEQQAGKVVYINVRSVERPTWRGLESDK